MHTNAKKAITPFFLIGGLLIAVGLFTGTNLVAQEVKDNKKYEQTANVIKKLPFYEDNYDGEALARYAKAKKKFVDRKKNELSTNAGQQFLRIIKQHYGEQLPDKNTLDKLRSVYGHNTYKKCINGMKNDNNNDDDNIEYHKKCDAARRFDEDSAKLAILWKKNLQLQRQHENDKISDKEFRKKFNQLKKKVSMLQEQPQRWVWAPEVYPGYKKVLLAAAGAAVFFFTITCPLLCSQISKNDELQKKLDELVSKSK